MSKILINFILLYYFSINPAHAYLDPGIGSIILQAVVGLIAVVVTTFGIYWDKFKNYYQKIKNKIKKKR
jgi:hypothetical protein